MVYWQRELSHGPIIRAVSLSAVRTSTSTLPAYWLEWRGNWTTRQNGQGFYSRRPGWPTVSGLASLDLIGLVRSLIFLTLHHFRITNHRLFLYSARALSSHVLPQLLSGPTCLFLVFFRILVQLIRALCVPALSWRFRPANRT